MYITIITDGTKFIHYRINQNKGFVATVQKKCRDAQVVVAGLVRREDKPHLNKSIDVINSVLSRQRSGVTFVNPNNGRNVDILKKDRLHMNAKGCKMMAQNTAFTMVI